MSQHDKSVDLSEYWGHYKGGVWGHKGGGWDEVLQKLKRLLEICSEFLVIFLHIQCENKNIGGQNNNVCPKIFIDFIECPVATVGSAPMVSTDGRTQHNKT